MGITVIRLDLDLFERLPVHTRGCVFWEVDGGSSDPELGLGSAAMGSFASEFDKEAWISGLLLEWGTCGQLAIDSATGSVVGTAFYAPPGRVPRATRFPTSPVSADAVLLTSIRTEPGFTEAATLLLDASVTDLIKRGVRAVEAFGLVRAAGGSMYEQESDDADPVARPDVRDDINQWTDAAIIDVAREILDHPQDDLCTDCMIAAGFLKDSAFDVVASHPRFPRFRLELDEGLGWKSEVEGALEKLVVMAAIDLAGRERVPTTVGRKHS